MENGLHIDAVGTKRWYQNDELHREDGPAVEYENGTKIWYQNGKLHRENGPALELKNSTKYWYQYGHLHRLDGPAVERISGNKEWHYQDNYINCQSQEEFERVIKLKVYW